MTSPLSHPSFVGRWRRLLTCIVPMLAFLVTAPVTGFSQAIRQDLQVADRTVNAVAAQRIATISTEDAGDVFLCRNLYVTNGIVNFAGTSFAGALALALSRGH